MKTATPRSTTVSSSVSRPRSRLESAAGMRARYIDGGFGAWRLLRSEPSGRSRTVPEFFVVAETPGRALRLQPLAMTADHDVVAAAALSGK